MTELLGEAVETPGAPRPSLIFSQESLPRDARVRFAVEPERPFVVRLKLAAGARAQLRALPGGALLGPCVVQDGLCQRFDVLGAGEREVEVAVEGAASGLLALDAAQPERRAPRSPALWPLLRREWALADTGRSWRTAMIARPGGRYVFELAVPPRAELWLGLGHEPGARAGPVRFVARQDGRVLLDEVVAPDRRWHDRRVALLAARRSRIELESFAAAEGSAARGLWADPRVLAAPGTPSVVLITIDALNPSHSSAYGYARDTSPALERIARAGARFDRAIAQAGTTWVSLPSLLSGLYPARDGVHARGDPPPEDLALLPDLLARRGYDTFAGSDLALFPQGYLSGFDSADAIDVPADTPEASVKRAGSERLAAQMDRLAPRLAAYPTFAWLHFEQPHYPLQPAEPLRYDAGYAGRFAASFGTADRLRTDLSPREALHVRALYDASVRDADALLLHLMAALDQAGALDRTLLIVTADHGEHVADARKLLEHASPYDAVLHVPLVMAGPGIAPRAVGQRVQLVDLVPTLLSLLQIPAPAVDGRDLGPALRGDPLSEAPAYAQVAPGIEAQYRGDETLIAQGARKELYDLSKDPQQALELSSSDPARAQAAEAALQQQQARWRETALESAKAPLGQDALEGLRAAGYLQETP